MDQTHDIAHYLDQGIREFASGQGGVHYIVEPGRSFAAVSGWAKDEPFTAILFIGFPTEVDRDPEALQKILDDLEEDFLSQQYTYQRPSYAR